MRFQTAQFYPSPLFVIQLVPPNAFPNIWLSPFFSILQKFALVQRAYSKSCVFEVFEALQKISHEFPSRYWIRRWREGHTNGRIGSNDFDAPQFAVQSHSAHKKRSCFPGWNNSTYLRWKKQWNPFIRAIHKDPKFHLQYNDRLRAHVATRSLDSYPFFGGCHIAWKTSRFGGLLLSWVVGQLTLLSWPSAQPKQEQYTKPRWSYNHTHS